MLALTEALYAHGDNGISIAKHDVDDHDDDDDGDGIGNDDDNDPSEKERGRLMPNNFLDLIIISSSPHTSSSSLGKGSGKKNRISYGLFTDKKIFTHFFLEIEPMIAKTNFTPGPNEKSFFLLQLKCFTFSINL